MARDICQQVFGKRWSEMTQDEQKVALRYRRQANHYRHFDTDVKRLRETKQNRKQALIDALGILPICQRCGYDRYVGALEFHHTDPRTPDVGIGVFQGVWDVALTEAKKCQLICANCHREVHGQDQSPKRAQGRPRKADPLLETYLRASGLTTDQIAAAMTGRPDAT